ncbi:MAG TPA: Gfo/Idh/MocA family oxidoreductase [Gemmatimonadaceae bacterium]|nr:Gfo/Idh/MocA family oxidoreductase [Gemmatimonadaceae bacterium]
MTDESKPISRRTFVRDSATAAAAFAMAPTIVPRHVLGGVGYRAPSRTLNVAMIGFGGMGLSNMNALLQAGENIVAVCDIDYGYVERSIASRLRPRQGQAGPSADALKIQQAYTKAKKYDDFRTMFDQAKDIDAVVIATPDHLHAIAAYTAMKHGKHVYVQKPLTYTVQEARLLARTARDTKVVSQMGNQGHSMDGTRRINEIIASGVLGPVREVHTWTDRPQRFWAQGIPRPGTPLTPTNAEPGLPPRYNMRTVDNAVLKQMAADAQAVPAGVHWDLFLGPTTREIAYHPAYHPFSWRGFVDFGVSAIGDMGAHIIDQPFWALGLDYPTSIIASSTPWGGGEKDPGTYPLAMLAGYEFAARGDQPPVRLTWYDGGLLPVLSQDIPLPREGGGGVFVTDKGFLTYETYGNNPKVYPAALAAEAEKVPKTFPRITTSHEANWANACKGEGSASSPFEYASKLTETMLLGIVALRAGQSRKILYDGAKMQVTNAPEVNRWLTREYRQGWQPWSAAETVPVIGG